MRILFLSRRNAGRSVLAEQLARAHVGPDHEVSSAGVEPAALHPVAAQVLREAGVELTDHAPRAVTPELLAASDLVVVVCERDLAGDLPPGVRKLHWPIMDPLDPPAAAAELLRRFRDVRIALEKHVKALGKMRLGKP